jgi:hypothetical protein
MIRAGQAEIKGTVGYEAADGYRCHPVLDDRGGRMTNCMTWKGTARLTMSQRNHRY